MKIEDIIKQRKSHLDVESPPADLWDSIRDDWKGKKNTTVSLWWKAAAVIFITLSLGLLMYSYSLQQQVNELASLSDLSSDYAALEKDYIHQINQIENSLPLKDKKIQNEYDWLFEEIALLEEVNQTYRADIGKVNNEELVGVLIDYYEKKIKLLKKLELEIKRTNKLNEHEATTTDHIII